MVKGNGLMRCLYRHDTAFEWESDNDKTRWKCLTCGRVFVYEITRKPHFYVEGGPDIPNAVLSFFDAR